MAITGEKDQWGNVYDSRGFWWGVGENEGDIFYNGQWVTSFAGIGKELASSPEPKAASSGGGGSTNPSTIFIQNNPGQLKIQKTAYEGDGTGFPPGTVYQEDQVTGATNILYRPSTSEPASLYNDRNNDGYDDQTGLPNGVTKVDKALSPTGLVYQGKPVNADGSLYTGSSGTGRPDAPTWTGYGPKGQGTYYLDGPNGTPGTFIGATQQASSGSSNISVAGVKGYTSSGGGGSSAASRDYAGEQAASDARQAQMAADARAWQSAQNDLDRQIRAQEFQANYGLNVAQFQAQQARDQAAQKSSDLRDFSSAVSDTDMAKFQAILYANGYNAGGTIANRLSEDPNAFFSELANVRAAGLLDQIRNGYGSVAPPGVPSGGTLGTGAPTGAPVGTGSTGGAVSPLPSTQANQPTPDWSPTKADGSLNPAYYSTYLPQQQAEQAKQQAFATRSGWEPVSGPNGIMYQEVANGVPTGKTMTRDAYMAMQQRQAPIENPSYEMQMMDALQNEQERAQAYARVQGIPYVDPFAGKKTATGGPAGEQVTLYNMPWGWSTTNQTPVMPGLNYGDDNVQRALPVAGAGGPTNEPTGVIPRATVALANGGGPVSGALIAGDPQTPGQPNPELITGQNIRVTPLNQMPPAVAGSLMQNTPKAAFGTEEVSPFSTIGAEDRQRARQAQMNAVKSFATPIVSTAPTTQTTTPAAPAPVATTAGSGSSTSAPSTPSTVSPSAPPPAAQTSAAATGSLVTPTGQTVQQPTAPAPATGGLGSITDIVNGTNTPTSQALLDEIAQWRANVPLPNVNPLSLEFQRLDPLTQQSILQARQTKSYIPVAAQQYEINKYRIGGGRALSGSLAF